MDAFFCIISIESSPISTMCKRKHLIWLFRSSPPTSKIKCYPSFPPYSQTLSLWSLLIHKWVCFKPNHKEKNLISIFWSCFVFLARILPAMLCYSKSQDFSLSTNLSCKLWILNWNILPLKNILWNFTYFHLSVWIGLKSKMAQIFCTLPLPPTSASVFHNLCTASKIFLGLLFVFSQTWWIRWWWWR